MQLEYQQKKGTHTPCEECGNPLPNEARMNKRFCSKACQDKSYRKRHPEQKAQIFKSWHERHPEKQREYNRRQAEKRKHQATLAQEKPDILLEGDDWLWFLLQSE